MYLIVCDGSIVHDTMSENSRTFSAILDMELNTPNFLNFTIYPSNPMYNHIKKFASVIEVYQNNTLLFRGRAVSETRQFDNSKTFSCEGDRAFLNDTILRAYSYSGTIEDYIQMMLDSHNSQVEPEKQFILGNVTVTDPNDYITRSSIEYVKTWDEMKSKLIDNLGGYFLVRRVGNINYLDYLIDSDQISTQVIELGKNLLDVIRETQGENLITGIVPLGARLEDEEGNETDERLTIESVNDGLDYILDSNAVSLYGKIFDTVIYDNITLPQNLLTRASQELAIRANIGESVELNAIDLSMVKEPQLWGRNLIENSAELHEFDETITTSTDNSTHDTNSSLTWACYENLRWSDFD